MITSSDLKDYLSSNITDDIMGDIDCDDEIVDNIINDSYTELRPLNDYIQDDEVIDVYAKVLSAVSLLDRQGIPEGAFEGLRRKEVKIRALIEKIILDKKISGKKAKVVGIVPRDENVIITDDFIDRFVK